MKKTLLLILSCFLLESIHAQIVKVWTLEDCIKHAIDHNIAIKQKELQKENAAIDLNTLKMSRLPNLNAGAGQNWNFGRSEMGTGLYQNTTQSNTSFSVNTAVPLFTGFKISNEIARGKLDLEAATENLNKAKEDVALNVTSLFLQVLFKRELLKVSQELLRQSELQIGKTKTLVEVGKVPQSQLYDMEAQVAKDEVSVIQAKNDLALALLDLSQSLELQDETYFDIYAPKIEEIMAERMDSTLQPSLIFDNAVNTKPAIKEQTYKLLAAEKTLKIARSGYFPSLNLSAGYSTNYFHMHQNDFPNAAFSEQFKNNAGEFVGLSLNIPIFNRFSVRNQVRSAKLSIYHQQLELDNSKKTLYKEIQTAYLNATAAQEKYHASNKAVKATGESWKYAQERYEIGKSSVFEFNDARTKLIQSQSEQIQAKYDYIFRTKILDFYNGVAITL